MRIKESCDTSKQKTHIQTNKQPSKQTNKTCLSCILFISKNGKTTSLFSFFFFLLLFYIFSFYFHFTLMCDLLLFNLHIFRISSWSPLSSCFRGLQLFLIECFVTQYSFIIGQIELFIIQLAIASKLVTFTKCHKILFQSVIYHYRFYLLFIYTYNWLNQSPLACSCPFLRSFHWPLAMIAQSIQAVN